MTAKSKAEELFIKHHDAAGAASYVRQKIAKGFLLWEGLQVQTERFWLEVIDELYRIRRV